MNILRKSPVAPDKSVDIIQGIKRGLFRFSIPKLQWFYPTCQPDENKQPVVCIKRNRYNVTKSHMASLFARGRRK